MKSRPECGVPRRLRSGPRSRAGAIALLAVAACALALPQAACQKTVLRPDDVRSPYDRYERVRAERADPYLEDEFGRRTPNLRGRLLERSE